MTSPIGSKPSQTVKDYETVHGQGSRFGQDLDEAKVRKLLSNRVSNPFTKAAANFVQTINQVVNDIADAIRGEGAGYSVISGAVDERLGPLDTAITESGKNLTVLADKVEAAGRVQDGLIKDNEKAIKNAKDALSEASKNREDLAEFNKQISDKVVTLTTSADNAIKKADSISQKQTEIISNADKQKKVVDQAVLDLTTVTNNFNAYKQAQNEQLKKLTAQADKGIADAKTANDAIAKANKELSGRIADGVAAHEDVRAARKDADKAASEIESLDRVMKESVDIGASLVPLVPGTRTPTWTTHGSLNVSTGEEGTPVEGLQVVTLNNPRRTNFTLPEQYVKVSDKVRYKVSFWIRSENGPSSLLLGMRTPESSAHPIDTSREEAARPTANNDPGVNIQWTNGWVIGLSQIDSTWRRAEYTVKFLPGTEYVSFDKIWWSYYGAGGITEQQWIADLRIEPEIPDQATIDRLQNEAILKNAKVGSTNATAIEVLDKAWEAQDTINKNQEKWNAASTTATSANTQAIQALARRDFRQSLLQYRDLTPEDIENGRREVYYPYWALATDTYRDFSTDKAFIEGPHNQKDMWGYTQRASVAVNSHHAYMPVEEGKHYKLSLWHRAKDPGSVYFIQMITPSGQDNSAFRIVQGVDSNGNIQKSGPTSYIVSNREMPADRWEKIEVVIEIEPGVSELSFRRIFWNHANGKDSNGNTIKTDQWITGLEFGPDIPTQADIDKAQNAAISALTKQQALDTQFQKEQRNWNKASSDATKALSKATKLLAKPNYGDSLIAYETPSDSSLEKPGAMVNWELPEWERAFYFYNAARGLSIHFGSYEGKKSARSGQTTLLPVKPDTEYRLSFWAFGEDEITLSVATDLGTTGIASSKEVIEGKEKPIYKEVSHGGRFPVRGAKLSSSPKQFTYLVKFDPKVTKAGIDAFWFVDSGKTTTAEQNIGGLVFEPNVPTQEQVDKAQDKALESLGESAELGKKFEQEQRKTNRLIQQQLWSHRDMIELVDIRTPKTFGWGTKEGTYSKVYAAEGRSSPFGPFGYYNTTAYFEIWETSNTVYVACRGTWSGQLRAAINWDNGAIDDWTVDVEKKARVFAFTGGAAHIDKRYITVTVFPRSLNREARVSCYPGGGKQYLNLSVDPERPRQYFSRFDDTNILIREQKESELRLKNTVTCNRSVFWRDENNKRREIKPGEPISGVSLYPEDQDIPGNGAWFTFTEVDDPGAGEYTVPDASREKWSVSEMKIADKKKW